MDDVGWSAALYWTARYELESAVTSSGRALFDRYLKWLNPDLRHEASKVVSRWSESEQERYIAQWECDRDMRHASAGIKYLRERIKTHPSCERRQSIEILEQRLCEWRGGNADGE